MARFRSYIAVLSIAGATGAACTLPPFDPSGKTCGPLARCPEGFSCVRELSGEPRCASAGTSEASIDLDFARMQQLPPGLGLTRGSIATAYDSAGVLRETMGARLDHDPARCADGGTAGASTCPRWPLGLLVESDRTNLVTESESFSAWALEQGAGTVTPDVALSPAGTLTADRLSDTGGFPPSYWYRSRMLAGTDVNATFTASLFIEKRSATASAGCRLGFGLWFLRPGDQQTGVYFNAADGGVSTRGQAPLSAGAIDVGAFWRVWVTAIDDGNSEVRITFLPSDDCSGMGSFVAWGAQLERGSAPSSYVRTGATVAKREADRVTLGEVSAINPAAGTLVVEHTASGNATGAGALIAWSAGGDGHALGRSAADGRTAYEISQQGAGVLNLTTTAFTPWSRGFAARDVASYSAGAQTLTENQTSAAEGKLATLPGAPAQVSLGFDSSRDAGFLNGWLRRVTVWPRQLDAADRQSLASAGVPWGLSVPFTRVHLTSSAELGTYVVGGTPPYTFEVASGPGAVTGSGAFTPGAPGLTAVTVTDAAGSAVTLEVETP